MSSTTGVPPAASTACATAAPSPEDPPVTNTVPSSDTSGRLSDKSAGRVTVDVGDEDGLAAPFGERLGLWQVGDRVVAALDPDVRPDPPQYRARVVLLEDDDLVDAGECAKHGGAVALPDERPLGAFQARDRRVGVQADHQPVAERPGLL